jgi:hypothetical protein
MAFLTPQLLLYKEVKMAQPVVRPPAALPDEGCSCECCFVGGAAVIILTGKFVYDRFSEGIVGIARNTRDLSVSGYIETRKFLNHVAHTAPQIYGIISIVAVSALRESVFLGRAGVIEAGKTFYSIALSFREGMRPVISFGSHVVTMSALLAQSGWVETKKTFVALGHEISEGSRPLFELTASVARETRHLLYSGCIETGKTAYALFEAVDEGSRPARKVAGALLQEAYALASSGCIESAKTYYSVEQSLLEGIRPVKRAVRGGFTEAINSFYVVGLESAKTAYSLYHGAGQVTRGAVEILTGVATEVTALVACGIHETHKSWEALPLFLKEILKLPKQFIVAILTELRFSL